MKTVGATLFAAGIVIVLFVFLFLGNHGIPFQDPTPEQRLYAALGNAKLDMALLIGGLQTLMGALTWLASCLVFRSRRA